MAAHMTLTWRALAVATSLCAAEPVGLSTFVANSLPEPNLQLRYGSRHPILRGLDAYSTATSVRLPPGNRERRAPERHFHGFRKDEIATSVGVIACVINRTRPLSGSFR
jgi:hypothetical protein